MYQIFVVEDEMLIRQNIRRMIENMKGPYACCGEASDGEMALSIMQDVMPDILLTDIRMPFLDGFELIKHARAMMPWLKVAVISGYDDFEYARKAISLGVDSYLLKPVSGQELAQEVHKLGQRIDEERAARTASEGIEREEIDTALRQHYMQQLLYSRSNTGDFLEKARMLKLDIVRSCYRTVLFHFDGEESGIRQLLNPLRRIFSEQEIELYYFNQSDDVTVLFYGNDSDELVGRIYRFISILRHEVREICPVVTVVMSSQVNRLSEIASACSAAWDLFNKVRMVSAGQVIDADDAAQLAVSFLDFSEPFGSTFRQKLQYCKVTDLEALLDETLNGPARQQFDSVLMRYYALVGILRIAVDMICAKNRNSNASDVAAQIVAGCDITAASGKRDTFRQTALCLLGKAVSTNSENAMYQKHYHVLARAEEYIDENFCDPNISLMSVAGHVGMSAAHFSTVFSQTFGRSFITYLTEKRIEKARELLTMTDMKLADIAMEIGYNEPNYFSHVFKKTVGITPKEYRNRPDMQDQ